MEIVPLEGVGQLCDAHAVEGDPESGAILCRFPGKNQPQCHHCGSGYEPRPDTPIASIFWCSEACSDAWSNEHPREASKIHSIEETLPGGRYDGIWENSGLRLAWEKSTPILEENKPSE